MKLAIDKVTLSILLVIIVVTTILVVVLQSKRPPITANVRIKCRQINFDVIIPETSIHAFSLLNSGLWIANAKVTQFDRISFSVPRSLESTELAHLCDGTEITISGTSSSSYVDLRSAEESFSVRDIFIESDVRISWGTNEKSQHILFQEKDYKNHGEIALVFSTADSLHLSFLNCVFLDRNGNSLYQTEQNVIEDFSFPVSFGKSQANVIDNTGRLEIEFTPQAGSAEESDELLRDLVVGNVDYYKEEYTRTGHKVRQNTILEGTIKRPAYSLDDSVRIRKGDLINTTPAKGYLKYLETETGSLEASMEYRVRSMRVGPDSDSEHELVRSKLDILSGNRTLIVIYSITVAAFGLITKFVVQRRRGSN